MEQIQCHGLRDGGGGGGGLRDGGGGGGHSMAEYHDPVFTFVYVINNMFRDMQETNEVICGIILRVIST